MKRVVAVALALLMAIAPADAKSKRSRSSAKKSAPAKTPIPQGPFSAVVIDPGHGGHDVGGIPQNIIHEKGVALDVSLRLNLALQAAGLRTFLTRNDDVFVTLADRVALANAHPEAIFVSVHFNSGLRTGARGIETFYASPSGAALAARIQSKLVTLSSGDNRGTKRATFWVLRKTKIRSVLVECGFLTNPDDAALAQDPTYRQSLAEQIAAAIVEYRDSLL